MNALVAAYWRGVDDFRRGWHLNPYAHHVRRALAVMWMQGHTDASNDKYGKGENDG